MASIEKMIYNSATLGGLYVYIVIPEKDLEVEIFNIHSQKEYNFNVSSATHDWIKNWEMDSSYLRKYRPTLAKLMKDFEIVELQKSISHIENLLFKLDLSHVKGKNHDEFQNKLSKMVEEKVDFELIKDFVTDYANKNGVKNLLYEEFRSNCKLSKDYAQLVLDNTDNEQLIKFFSDSKNVM